MNKILRFWRTFYTEWWKPQPLLPKIALFASLAVLVCSIIALSVVR